MNKENPTTHSPGDIQACVEVLEHLVNHTIDLARLPEEQRVALMSAAGRLSRPDRDERRRRTKERQKSERKQVVKKERQARAATGIRRARDETVFVAPRQITGDQAAKDRQEERVLNSPRNCYVCKAEYRNLHSFYDAMCMDCAQFNYEKRFQTAPMHGMLALITGSRLKIGYQATLMMLRAGARVIATTRFPVDSALRYAKETDYADWADRLHIYGLDLRHTPSVELFCDYVERQYDRLDILVNNAAQTVRRPPAFYAHLMPNEALLPNDLPDTARSLMSHYDLCRDRIQSLSLSHQAESDLPVTWTGETPGIGLRASAQLSQIPYAYDHASPTDEIFPTGQLDADLQQVDLRTVNSWRLRLGEIQTSEMLELQLINAVAPFVLCNRLTPMMKRENTGQKHIVNVSAMEGKFFRFKKDDRHPHTNMAKAALNMLTHTSASDLAKSGIFMNAVDTGWVTDEDPAVLSKRKQDLHDFQPPLDIVDGAARVCDPFFHGILTGRHWSGKFLKDYQPIDW